MITSVSANSLPKKEEAIHEQKLPGVQESDNVDKIDESGQKEGTDAVGQGKEPRYDHYQKGSGIMPEMSAAKQPEKSEEPTAAKESESETTGNTDHVDAEIRKLRDELKKLEQQLSQTSGDDPQRKQLERSVADVKAQLLEKDNDSYRKQHTVFS